MIRQLKAPLKLLSLLIRLASGHAILKTMMTGLPIDKNGQAIPWFTYPAIDFLSRLELSSSKVFEYGAGQSTLFWARRAEKVVSVEHDAEWFIRLRASLPSNVTLMHAPGQDAYPISILETSSNYDIVVVDGVWREACIQPALSRLAPAGLLILDNSDWYPEVCARLREQGLLEFSFAGIGPVNRITWVTSVFVKGSSEYQRGMHHPRSCFGVPMASTVR